MYPNKMLNFHLSEYFRAEVFLSMIDLFFLISLTLITYVYLIYPFLLWIISILHPLNKKRKRTETISKFSIIVPTYNEELVIKSKLQSLVGASHIRDYEIIVVDSGSNDHTCDIVHDFKKNGVALIRQEKRLGKASAINLALNVAKEEIIVITDANSKVELEEIFQLIQNFDSNIGAVLPRLMPTKNAKLWHKLFYQIHHVVKTLESKCDSVFFVFGELFMFRKKLIDKIDENIASDDLEIAFKIRRKGYKIKYVPHVRVFEKTPDTIRDDRLQRVRRAFGVLQVMVKNKDMLLNPKFGVYGLVIFPTNFLRLTVIPFLTLLVIALCLIKFFNLIFLLFSSMYHWLFLVGLFCFLIMLSKKFRQLVAVFINFALTQVYIISALIDLLRGKSYRVWEKIETTRTE